jgi:hypothetical protein
MAGASTICCVDFDGLLAIASFWVIVQSAGLSTVAALQRNRHDISERLELPLRRFSPPMGSQPIAHFHKTVKIDH